MERMITAELAANRAASGQLPKHQEGGAPPRHGWTYDSLKVNPTPWLRSSHEFAPGVKESAGMSKGNASTGHGNRYLARALGEAAVGASRTNTFLGERYRRIARRRGNKKAIVAVGRSILVCIWQLLSTEDPVFADLGPDHYDNRGGTQRAVRNHIRGLQALGYQVTLQAVA